MNINQFKEESERRIDALKTLIENNIIKTGDTSDECHQRMLLNRLYFFEQVVNGTEAEDLVH